MKRKRKYSIVAQDDLLGHRVMYRATQVERCLACYGVEVRVGLRCALLDDISEFRMETGVPKAIFYTGEITRIWGNPDDPFMDFTYDSAPAVMKSMGIKQYAHFLIPLPKERKKLSQQMQKEANRGS